MFSPNGSSSQIEHQLEVFIPPKPNRITKKFYGCGKRFITETIKHLFQNNNRYFGLAIIHGENAKICLFNEAGFDVIKQVNEQLATRHNKGGQSQRRHERNYDIIVNVYMDKVVDAIKESFLDETGVPIVKGIAVAGTGEKRFGVMKKLPKILRDLIFREMTIPSQKTTPDEILEQYTAEFIQIHTLTKEQSVWNDWKHHFALDDGLAVYGKKETTTLFADGSLKILIVHTSIFEQKGDKISEIANKVGCELVTISSISEAGSELLRNYGGVVGIKWF
jgi:peptide chain release factor subunit 1